MSSHLTHLTGDLRGILASLEQRMSMNANLEKYVCLMSQDVFDMDTFPWVKGLRKRHAQKIVRGRCNALLHLEQNPSNLSA
jgi:hypothetical protein